MSAAQGSSSVKSNTHFEILLMCTTTLKSNYKGSNGNNNTSYVLKIHLLDSEGHGKLEYLVGGGGGWTHQPDPKC